MCMTNIRTEPIPDPSAITRRVHEPRQVQPSSS